MSSEEMKGRENGRTFYDLVLKRALDVAFSLLALSVLWPFLLILSVLIFIDDPGPVFFTQKRIGIGKSYFKVHKFRTMKMSTPHDVPTHLLKDPDQYITRTGKILRRLSLDELPQLFDILAGKMSFVGPRPALWNQEDLWAAREACGANDVRPGLTGWAQIHGRDELEIAEKARLDGFYVKQLKKSNTTGIMIDLCSLFGTVFAVLRSDGVVEGGTGRMEEEKSGTRTASAVNTGTASEGKKLLLVANVAKEHVLKFHVPTIKMLKEEGWQVDVACSGEEEIPYCDHQYRMSYKRSPFNLALFKGIRELKTIIKNGQYDIVYCHTPVGGIAGRIAAKGARKQETEVIYMAHGYHFYKGAPLLNWLLYYPVEKHLSRYTDKIILINQEDYELTKAKFKNGSTYFVPGIGVDLSRLQVEDPVAVRTQYRSEMNIPEDAAVLIYLAELLPNKNQTFLMRVLKRILETDQNVYLVLAGFDHTDGAFEAYAEELGIKDHVRFLGWREDVANLLTMADICTATSIREGFGLNLVEAMYLGLPVVAAKNRGHETIVRDGENGVLIDQGDEAGFEKAVLKMIQDEAWRKQLTETAAKEVWKYSSEEVLKQLKEILLEEI